MYVVHSQPIWLDQVYLEAPLLLLTISYDTTQQGNDFNRVATGSGEARKQLTRRWPLVRCGLACQAWQRRQLRNRRLKSQVYASRMVCSS